MKSYLFNQWLWLLGFDLLVMISAILRLRPLHKVFATQHLVVPTSQPRKLYNWTFRRLKSHINTVWHNAFLALLFVICPLIIISGIKTVQQIDGKCLVREQNLKDFLWSTQVLCVISVDITWTANFKLNSKYEIIFCKLPWTMTYVLTFRCIAITVGPMRVKTVQTRRVAY